MEYISFENLKKYPFVNAVFTSSDIDISKKEDREKICKDLDLNFKNLTFNKQVHGSTIRIVDENNIGETVEADGIITNLAKTPILTFVADCVSVGVIDINKKIIGVAHAGWRGTFDEIGCKLINIMSEKFQSKREDIIAIIGPSIGPCCYEVGEDLMKKFNDKFTYIDNSFCIMKEGRYFLDLWKVNENTLINSGIKRENIINLNLCTYCTNDLFHSYRRDNGTSKRMGLILELI